MKLMIFLASLLAATTALANADVGDVPAQLVAWTEPSKCDSVTRQTQYVISRLYSVTPAAVDVTISKAYKTEGHPFIAVGADVRVGRGICTLAWKTDLDSCARELDSLTCNQR